MITTIIIPISREQFLDQIFARLELMDCNPEETNILGIVDGDQALFVKARNLIQNSRFKERLCVSFKSSHRLRHYDTLGRRLRIADIHNQLRGYIGDCDYIMGIEDDTLVPTNALKKLLYDCSIQPHAGIISAVQIGRWGINSIGAYVMDDVYSPAEIKSVLPQEGLQSVDATGMFTFLTKRDNYINHEFKPFDNNSLGPDIEWTLSLRRSGFSNFIDYDLQVAHLTKNRQITPKNVLLQQVTFTRNDRGTWRQYVENI